MLLNFFGLLKVTTSAAVALKIRRHIKLREKGQHLQQIMHHRQTEPCEVSWGYAGIDYPTRSDPVWVLLSTYDHSEQSVEFRVYAKLGQVKRPAPREGSPRSKCRRWDLFIGNVLFVILFIIIIKLYRKSSSRYWLGVPFSFTCLVSWSSIHKITRKSYSPVLCKYLSTCATWSTGEATGFGVGFWGSS